MQMKEKLKERKSRLRENAGITLIALVVTIVVLLILAGVTITMVLGKDGIIAQAKLAAEKTKEAEKQQEEDMQNLTDEIDKALGTYVNRDIYVFLYEDGTLTFGTENTQIPEKELLEAYGNIKNVEFQDNDELPWSNYLERITKVDFLDEIHPVNTRRWFHGCTKLVEIEHIENLNTSDVVTMAWMFHNCSSLKELDLSNFKTDSCITAYAMFGYCTELVTLNVSSFNTNNFLNMEAMFNQCNKLEFLDVSNFNTENVESMSNMFHSCSKLKNLDVSGFNTPKLKKMSGMFADCYELTSLDMSSFDTNNLTDFYGVFSNCENLTTIYVGENWTLTDEQYNTNHVFSGCGTNTVTKK